LLALGLYQKWLLVESVKVYLTENILCWLKQTELTCKKKKKKNEIEIEKIVNNSFLFRQFFYFS
jgi:hypothetical protein